MPWPLIRVCVAVKLACHQLLQTYSQKLRHLQTLFFAKNVAWVSAYKFNYKAWISKSIRQGQVFKNNQVNLNK
jgi:hypothetical protein